MQQEFMLFNFDKDDLTAFHKKLTVKQSRLPNFWKYFGRKVAIQNL